MVTRKRNLRTGASVWEKSIRTGGFRRSSPSLKFYDVVVIGGGISGALAAEALGDLRLSVLLVDRRRLASGSTGASTALIQWEIDQPLTGLTEKIGKRDAEAAYCATYAAVRRLRRLIAALDIDCRLTPRKSLLIAGTEMDGKALKRETRARRRLKLPSTYLDPSSLLRRYGIARDGAILSAGNLELDPVRLTLGLLHTIQRRGVEIVQNVEVTALDATERGVFVELDHGDVVAARKVIAATGYEILHRLPSSPCRLISTWAVATVPQSADVLWKGRELVWEASDPYLYMRTTSDNRIIAGGEDADFSDPERRDRLIALKTDRVLSKLSKLIPDANLNVDYRWAGTFAETATGLPVIGPVADQPNVFATLGAGGNGITYSVIAARQAAAWVKSPLT